MEDVVVFREIPSSVSVAPEPRPFLATPGPHIAHQRRTRPSLNAKEHFMKFLRTSFGFRPIGM